MFLAEPIIVHIHIAHVNLVIGCGNMYRITMVSNIAHNARLMMQNVFSIQIVAVGYLSISSCVDKTIIVLLI
jgi:hypothetical protein